MHSFRHFAAVGAAACLLAAPAWAQEEPAIPHAQGVRIVFLPPPVEGSITLGMFNDAGKLVRVLKREAVAEDFTVGLNGLITQWDGLDDSGAAAPVGKYQARGFALGSLEVEGVAYYGNDWITSEESIRLSRVVELALAPDGGLLLKAAKPGTTDLQGFRYDAASERLVPMDTAESFPATQVQELPSAEDVAQAAAGATPGRLFLKSGKLWRSGGESAVAFPDHGRVISASAGTGSTLWIIDEHAETGKTVKQFSADGELLRALPVDPAEPAPTQIVADPTRDAIHLLEVSPQINRVRSLVLEPAGQDAVDGAKAVSTWRTLISKSIRGSKEYSEKEISTLRGKLIQAEDKISIRLVPNPLFRNQAATAQVQIAVTPAGSLLKMADGLPIQQLTETRGLLWAIIAQEKGTKALTLLQSDGAVIEEYRIRKLGQMMTFDAGSYELAR